MRRWTDGAEDISLENKTIETLHENDWMKKKSIYER